MAGDDLIRLMHSLFLPVAGTVRDLLWRPAADVYRTHTGWVVQFELAGVRPEDLEVCVCGNVLTVRGVRRGCLPASACQTYQMEIACGPFERSVVLPCDLERAQITTEYQHGILLVHLSTEADHDD